MTHLSALRPRFVRRLGAAIGSVVLAGASVVATTSPASAVDKMTHDQATAALSSSGITWSSSGNCSDRDNSTCTSFDQVNVTTIQGIQTLKSASGCSINVTGGTETGHADGTYSHWNGYKLDISKYSCVSATSPARSRTSVDPSGSRPPATSTTTSRVTGTSRTTTAAAADRPN